MVLNKLTDRIFYYPHEVLTDRPMLAYIKGDMFSLAIDAGNSAKHVDEFYALLGLHNFKKPALTVITHWHWDHTFGMHGISGLSIAYKKTNDFLRVEKEKLLDSSYVDFMKKDDECFKREYEGDKSVVVVLADIEFTDKLVLNLGGLTAVVFHDVSPHSEDSVFIYIPEEKVLFLGDSTSEDFFNNGYMDKEKLKSLIKLIEGIDCEYCILSHTEPLAKNDLLSYLYTL